MKRRTSLLLAPMALALLLSPGALAQEDPGLELIFRDFKASGLSDPEDAFEEEVEQDLSEWFLSIRTNNAKERSRTVVYQALEGEGIDFGWKGWDYSVVPASLALEKVYGARYRTTMLIRGSGKWIWSPFTSLGLYSDFRKLSVHDLRLEGGLTFIYDQGKSKKSSTRFIGFGVGYVNNFGEPEVLPLFRYYRKSEHSSFDVLLPLRLDMRIVSRAVDVGIGARVEGNAYAITENREVDGITGLRTGDEIQFSVATGGLFAELKLGRLFVLKVEYGQAFNRVYRVEGRDGGGYELEVKPNQYWTLGLILRR